MAETKTRPKRRWWLILLGAFLMLIVVVVGGAYVAGSSLDAEVRSTVSMTFNHPPQAVWDAIADYDRNPISGSMRRATTPMPDGEHGPSWKEDIGNTVITVRTLESDEPKRLVRHFEDAVVPMTSEVEYLIEPEGDGAKVTVSSLTTVNEGTWHVPFFRVMLRIAPDAGSFAYLTDLLTHLNTDSRKDEPVDELS